MKFNILLNIIERRINNDMRTISSKNGDIKKKIIIARAAIFIMIILISGLILYMYTVDRVKHAEEKSIEDYRIVQYERLYSELQLLTSQAYDNARNIAQNIETELRQQNLDELKYDMDNGEINEEMYETIESVIEGRSMNNIDNYRNGIIVMTQNGILEDFNYERVSSIKDRSLRTWDVEIDAAYNQELEKEAINRLLNHSNALIATETINRLGMDHIKISTLSYESLREIFLKEGIEGFKNYQFMSPAYITENGDIFGQDDIVQGIKQPNHKIIIVQEFNLYDQLKHMNSELFEMDDHILYIKKDFSVTLSIMYIMGLFYIASTITLLFYFSHLYNYYIREHGLDKEDTETDKLIEETIELQKLLKQKRDKSRHSVPNCSDCENNKENN